MFMFVETYRLICAPGIARAHDGFGAHAQCRLSGGLSMDKSLGRRERIERVKQALAAAGLDALLCAHAPNVLMLSGYASVTGASLALVGADGALALVVPEDEKALAGAGWADEVIAYQPATLAAMYTGRAALKAALNKAVDVVLPHARTSARRIGREAGRAQLPAVYASQLIHGEVLAQLMTELAPKTELVSADALLAGLRMRLTDFELARLRIACDIAATAFTEGAAGLAAGISEREATLPFSAAFYRSADRHPETIRAYGFFYCMSGPDGARAWAAFQQSGARRLRPGKPVLIHCNSHADGYWTDLTRSYVIGAPDARLARIQEAIVAARAAALSAIRPGVAAGAVDRAARDVLEDAGYGAQFRHTTGHGVGFIAIDHEEPPQLHPQSDEPLQPGMVFNVEPGVYIDGYGGVRDCNMVAVTEDGYELLSPFQLERESWRIA
jgi:Xaa-Pro aminopeptidase